jgi:hypothetical protein
VRFVLRHDRERLFRLLPAQTRPGRALYVQYGRRSRAHFHEEMAHAFTGPIVCDRGGLLPRA